MMPGLLIAIEGIDGSGKTTQAELLEKWLREAGHNVWATRWNSSQVIKPLAKHAKQSRALTPRTLSLLEAADFADRYDTTIAPDLQKGHIVCADRWFYTAIARGVARGVSREWLAWLYAYALHPDLCFYLDVPVLVARDRILATRHLKYYEAGMDLGLTNDMITSFQVFQDRAKEEYSRMLGGFRVIDATQPVERQHALIRIAVEKLRGSRSAHL